MKRTIATILAGSLAALTLGVTAAHAEDRDDRGPQLQQQRYDRDDEGWRYDRPQARGELRHKYDRDDDRYRESRRDHDDDDRNARVDVYERDRGVSIDIGGWFVQR